MNTAISLPDDAAYRFDRIARRHGMTRSEFYRRAAEQYADALAEVELTSQINDAIDAVGQPGDEFESWRRAASERLLGSGAGSPARWE